jgi:2-oxoglutarate ferredoxin oxidoreductase subunit delta
VFDTVGIHALASLTVYNNTSMKTQKGSIEISQERCKGCFFCIEYCPKKAISLSDKLNLKGYFVAAFDGEQGCTGCATCALACPETAIEVYKA